jgi:hypothetical protein
MISRRASDLRPSWRRLGPLLAVLFWTVLPTHAQPAPAPGTCRVQVIGFPGGHFLPNWLTLSGFGEIARDARQAGADVCVETFPGALAPRALKFARGHPGALTIIYGYSSGGWSAMKLARQLGNHAIAVELLVLIDTPWFARATIAPNVRRAANYYERRTWWMPFLMGTGGARVQDPARTRFEGNIRLPKIGHFAMPRQAAIRALIADAIRRRLP